MSAESGTCGFWSGKAVSVPVQLFVQRKAVIESYHSKKGIVLMQRVFFAGAAWVSAFRTKKGIVISPRICYTESNNASAVLQRVS